MTVEVASLANEKKMKKIMKLRGISSVVSPASSAERNPPKQKKNTSIRPPSGTVSLLRRQIKKLHSIRISELIVIGSFIPFVFLISQGNVNVGVTAAPPQAPEITTITVHPNLRAITIAGESIYNTAKLYLEDTSRGRAVELSTDKDGRFVAALDPSQFTKTGTHQVRAIIEIKQNNRYYYLESDLVTYSLDKNFNLVLDPADRSEVSVLTQDIASDKFKARQSQHRLLALRPSEYQVFTETLSYYQEMNFWLTVYKWIIYLILITFIPFALLKRWQRKKAEHQSFWHLGNGVYVNHKQ